MSWFQYVPIEKALPMVEAVNNATTEREHRDAQLRLEGYKKRCEEIGQTWPGCDLDLHFMAITDRPMCCGEYLDWQPANERAGRE